MSNKEEKEIVHKFSGQKVSDIIKSKRASIKQATLPEGAPSWEEFCEMFWEDVEAGVAANKPGFKVVRKLLSDKRFDK